MPGNLADQRAAFQAALRAGDEREARRIATEARASGVDPATIYYDIFAPAMVAIGDLWERNELSVAEEHLATAITERLIAELSPAFSAAPAESTRGTAVLGCVEGERHALGLRMLADLFRRQGWRVLYLGADVPSDDWVRLVTRYQADVVAVSASTERRAGAVEALIGRLREARPEARVIVGGAAFAHDPELWRTVGATLYDRDPVAVVARVSDESSRHAAGRA